MPYHIAFTRSEVSPQTSMNSADGRLVLICWRGHPCMRMSGARIRAGFVLLLGACSSSEPADLVEKLASADPALFAQVRPRAGVWQNGTSPGWRSAEMGPYHDVGARLPARADGPIKIGIGQSPEFRVTLVPEDSSSSMLE